MGSLGGGEGGATRNKAMWVCPKINGAKPSERWGHSACYFNGTLYVFGGCRGGVHFSDVLVCNLAAMTWSILRTSGAGPGPRDSHTAVVVGARMLVFGGTNGSKKVNDLHVLDLASREWTRPECRGPLPPARESHTAYVVDGDKMVVFGGSGEGGANYLNDVHVLDLKTMAWSSPDVRGTPPAPRDSHSAVAVGNQLFVFGGDSGDRYQGDVSVLDMNNMAWSRVVCRGVSPAGRAGHAAVSIGTKVYVLGGVGDKHYYSDIWVLDVITSAWIQLDIGSHKSQGRFSHTATVTNLGIAIFGGCGEDERPLNELLILQLHKDEMKMKKEDQNQMNNMHKAIFVSDDEDLADVEELQFVPKQSFHFSFDTLHPKRRRTRNSNESEHKTQQSSSSQSSPQKFDDSCPSYRVHPLFHQKTSGSSCYLNNLSPIKQEHAKVVADSLSAEARKPGNLIGAEVRGQVDGAFDSGYLMTATVNGKVFRGVLFAPGPDIVQRSAIIGECPVPFSQPTIAKLLPPAGLCHAASEQTQSRSSPEKRARMFLGGESRTNAELQGVVLTLASPGSSHGVN